MSLSRVFVFVLACCVILAPSLASAREYRSLEGTVNLFGRGQRD